jgi:hypothetical protein
MKSYVYIINLVVVTLITGHCVKSQPISLTGDNANLADLDALLNPEVESNTDADEIMQRIPEIDSNAQKRKDKDNADTAKVTGMDVLEKILIAKTDEEKIAALLMLSSLDETDEKYQIIDLAQLLLASHHGDHDAEEEKAPLTRSWWSSQVRAILRMLWARRSSYRLGRNHINVAQLG